MFRLVETLQRIAEALEREYVYKPTPADEATIKFCQMTRDNLAAASAANLATEQSHRDAMRPCRRLAHLLSYLRDGDLYVLSLRQPATEVFVTASGNTAEEACVAFDKVWFGKE